MMDPDIFSLLKNLVEIESPSTSKSAVDRLGGSIAEECQRLGAQVIFHKQKDVGDLIEAHWDWDQQRSQKGEPDGILILCHMDTVFPPGTIKGMPFYEDNGLIFGPGVADMKGGIVVALTALKTITNKGKPHRPITILFTSDEEIGSEFSRPHIEKLSGDASLVLVLEPGMVGGEVKTWRKGVGSYTIRTQGKAAHAGGDHEKGRNAIEELAHQVLRIQKLTDYRLGTTLNTGMIKGGIASNVVPDHAFAEIDLRVMQPGEAERIDAAVHQLQPVLDGTTIEVTGGLNRPPMPYNDLMRSTFEKAKKIGKKVGIDLVASGTGGASDANFVAPLGVPVLDGLGPAGAEYHSEREYIVKSSLLERVRLLIAILQDW
jgi:glutamate carboxypeptidase